MVLLFQPHPIFPFLQSVFVLFSELRLSHLSVLVEYLLRRRSFEVGDFFLV